MGLSEWLQHPQQHQRNGAESGYVAGRGTAAGRDPSTSEQQDPCGKFPLLGADPVCLSGNDFADLVLICHLLTPFKMKPATLGRVWSPVEPKAPQ